MKRVVIAHVSDTHLGYRALFRADPESGRNQRAVDIEKAYEQVVTDILTRDVDLVLHGGDVFHHTRPSWAAIRSFVRQTRRISERGIPMLVIGGNHDTPRLRTSGSVFSVLELALPDVTFIAGYDQDMIPYDDLNLAVTAVPHGKLVDPLGPSAIPVSGMRNILLTHGLVSGVKLPGRGREPGEEEVADFLLGEDFTYIGLGHFHAFSHVRHNAWYSGSTERIGWGDEETEPGYALVEIGATGDEVAVSAVPIDARPMQTLPALDGQSLSARDLAEATLARIRALAHPDGMARIQFEHTERSVRREAETILRREAAELVWSLQIYTPSAVLLGYGERGVEGSPTDIGGLFDEFVQSRDYEEGFRTAFAARGRRALDDAARALETSAAIEDSA